jgi:methylenetetrahydrofolate reductase (NADPH)
MSTIASPERTATATGDDQRRALVDALGRPRYEMLPLDGVADAVRAHVPREVKLTITASPSKGLDATLVLAEELRRDGYTVVPHLSARLIRDRPHLAEVISRLREAGVAEVFVIAGDAPEAAGDFAGAAGLLSEMEALRGGFADVGIAGYPESHHFISDEATIEAMFEKEPRATYIVSQICFDPEVISIWVRRVRDRGTLLPIWIGVPGAVDNRRLLRTSMRIGLGQSARFLRAHKGFFRRLLLPRRHTPTKLLQQLAPTFADPAARIGGIHVYTFNELEHTERWRRQLVDRLTRP